MKATFTNSKLGKTVIVNNVTGCDIQNFNSSSQLIRQYVININIDTISSFSDLVKSLDFPIEKVEISTTKKNDNNETYESIIDTITDAHFMYANRQIIQTDNNGEIFIQGSIYLY